LQRPAYRAEWLVNCIGIVIGSGDGIDIEQKKAMELDL
jgi:hypothetical protein